MRYLSGVLTLEILNPGCKGARENLVSREQGEISDRSSGELGGIWSKGKFGARENLVSRENLVVCDRSLSVMPR